jgi:N-acetylneuraminate synthase/pseudaminic acid synthase
MSDMDSLTRTVSSFVKSDAPVYVVAEMSANHNQNFEQAVQIIRAANEAGADPVKLQTYTADTLTIRSDKSYFRIGGGTLWDGRALYDLYAERSRPGNGSPSSRRLPTAPEWICSPPPST